MSPFRKVTGALGNMRKPVEWVIYPDRKPDGSRRGGRVVLIQSDNRIAAVDLDTGDAVLSDGKGGHPSFQRLSTLLGATKCICPSELLEQLRQQPEQVGPVRIL